MFVGTQNPLPHVFACHCSDADEVGRQNDISIVGEALFDGEHSRYRL